MEPEVTQRLAAVLAADVVGYSRLMAEDEAATIRTLDAARGIFAGEVGGHDGRIVDTAGDSVLAVFATAGGAVAAARAVQDRLNIHNADLPDDRRMRFRIGVHLGDIHEKSDGSIYGDGVNIAARMEALADAGGICITAAVHDAVVGKTESVFDFIGAQQVKNIDRPIDVYRVHDGTGRAHGKPKSHMWLIIAVAAVIVLASVGAIGYWTQIRAPAQVQNEIDSTGEAEPSIAVLPFANISGSAEQEYFVDGITEDLITELSRFEGLLVIARNSSFRFKGQAVDVAEVRDALGVRYVLEGGVRRAGDQVRVSAQLIDATTKSPIWAERYDRALTDIFAVQDEITQEIITALRTELGEVAATRESTPLTANAEAYDLYLQGRVLIDRRTSQANARAQDLLTRAIKEDSSFAAAYAALSWARFLGWYYAWPGDHNDIAIAHENADHAVALDPNLPSAHARRAMTLPLFADLDEAVAAAERAVALDANYAEGHAVLSLTYNWKGEATKALIAADRAIRLDPYSFVAHFRRGQAFFIDQNYEEAIRAIRASVALNPDFGVAYQLLASIYGLTGQADQAKAAVDELLRISPDFVEKGGVRRLPYRDKDIRSRLLEGLRQAGLDIPEDGEVQ